MTEKKEDINMYTDELAEKFARKVGAIPRPMETKSEINEHGAFVRQENAFIQPFGDKEGMLKDAKGRYTIYWAKGCNWSNRPIIVRDLLGLKDVISDQLVEHTGVHNKYGWGFKTKDYKDPITGVYFLSEFYKNADPNFKGRATTPTFADTIEKKVVNNDYHRLTNYLEVQFRPFQPKDAPDLYPKKYRKEIDDFNDWLYPHINNAHYRMAFCQSLEAYEDAYEDFYNSMDQLEKRLETNRFLFGDYITDSDIRFFVTLVRWDVRYFHNIGPTKHRIVDYKNIWAYARELYSLPAFKDNTDIRALAIGHDDKDKKLFADYRSRIAPLIDYEKLWAPDNSRRHLSRTPDEWFLRHPDDETYEEYASEISTTIWNSPDPKDRDPKNFQNSVNPEINPLKG